MEGRNGKLTQRDLLYLERACELAARGSANTSPNPPVGAVVVRDGEIVGEGYHHVAGSHHAEVEALLQAGDRARGATMYVTLEPCNHFGKTPPCSRAVIEAGVSRVVLGVLDPNPKTAQGGILALQNAGIEVNVANAPQANLLIEPFAHTISNTARPYTSLKMAASLNGYVAPRQGEQYWLTGPASGDFVRELRIAHDGVMVGAGTIRIDDPQLNVRPAHSRLRPYTRIVLCETDTVPADRRIFQPLDGYERTIVVAPAGIRTQFDALGASAELLFVGDDRSLQLDLPAAMQALRRRGMMSLLCEGGPTVGARMLVAGLVDRFYWLVAPAILASPGVPVLKVESGMQLPSIAFDRVEQLGDDVLLSGKVKNV